MNKKKIFGGAMAAVMLLGASSFAYFTDRAESSMSNKAGTLCLTNVTAESNLENMSPGDKRDIKFSYKNNGSLSMDTRITYSISYVADKRFQGTLGEIAKITEDSKDILVLNKDNNATVTVDGPVIKGTKDSTGVEVMEKNLKFELLDVDNAAQNMDFTIKAIVEGKQHANDAKWEELNTVEVTLNEGKVQMVEQSSCNVGSYDEMIETVFKTQEWKGGTVVKGFVDNVDEILAKSNVLGMDFKKNPVIPSELNGLPVTQIGSSAFFSADLDSVKIPETVTIIGDAAFKSNNLKSIELHDRITSIGDSAFASNKLTEVKLPQALTKINQETFRDNELVKVAMSARVTVIEEAAFTSNKIKDVQFNSSLKTIGKAAFTLNSIEAINLPTRLETIEDDAFSNNSIETVKIPDSVSSLGVRAFKDNQITSFTLGKQITHLPQEIFNRNKLTEYRIPDQITSVGRGAVDQNPIEVVQYGKGMPNITEDGLFNKSKVTKIAIPDEVKTIYKNALNISTGGTVYVNKIPGDTNTLIRGATIPFMVNVRSLMNF